MTDLKEADFFSTFPAALKQDEKMYAIGKLVSEELHITANDAEKNIIYANIDRLPEMCLDLLAYDLHIDWYDYNCSKDVKKELLRNGIKVHQKLGTKCAVQTVLQDIYKTAKIEEWFEYNGRPFYFRPVIGIEVSQEEVNIFLKYLRLVKNARSWLDAIVYSGIIDHKGLEKIVLKNILIRVTIPFWGCDILNGTRLLDGSVLVDARRRYNLVLGIKNGIKFYIKESIDTDRVCINILSCFNVHESVNGLKAVFQLGCSGFWFPGSWDIPGEYKIPLKVKVPAKASVVQDMDTTSLVNSIIKVYTEEKAGAAAVYRASIGFWQDGIKGQVLTAQTKHKAVARVSEKIGDVTITCRRNLCYLDGSGLLDGSRLLNAFYGKEDV